MASEHNAMVPEMDTLIPSKNDSVNIQLNNRSVTDPETKSFMLTWEKISVDLPRAKPTLIDRIKKVPAKQIKPIICNVDGMAKSNEVLAIMGASGAGKTSLLNALNFRNRGNLNITGYVKINGQLISTVEEIASISGYVQQDDLFVGCLTVKENLIFQAMLRMERHFTYEQRLDRVEEVMVDLNLKKCEDIMIGIDNLKKGISGGEKRRLAFASEVLTNPLVLFCDEPTSGLDSFMAVSVVECMKNLAKKGKTIICTIHQPSSEIFELFDKLCLLAEGRLAFIGSLPSAYKFFESQGYRVPVNYNPADFYIQKLAISPTDKENCLARMNKICDAFEVSSNKNEMTEEISNLYDDKAQNKLDVINFKEEISYKSSFFTQMRWLLWRNLVAIKRNPFAFKIQLIQTMVISILFGLIYFQLELSQKAVQNINGVLFLCLTNNSFSSLVVVLNTFPAEIPLFIREHQNRMYRLISYYMSKVIIEVPMFIVLPFFFMLIVYWMANIGQSIQGFLICTGIIILSAQAAVSFGNFLSATAPSTNVAIALAGPILVPLMIFSGFLINFDDVPVYFLFLRYISWFGYANEALQVNQWEGVKNITCESTGCIQAFSSGDLILSYLQMNPKNFAVDLYCIGILIIGWRVLTFIVLMFKSLKR